eukprot:TRINITY_DN33241_c0_g1_i1.p1 TRINITY_DN33241_c0_g1~~TRINITY_DN33241_c0_g1_i1.p1  ORF type:complete len:594 (-),score=130.99 TRINITY_DN33241_c0_g1_i1:29-1810(-)
MDDEDAEEDAQAAAAPSGGGSAVDPGVWAKAFEQRGGDAPSRGYSQTLSSPDTMYPPQRQQPNREPSLFPDGDAWAQLYGSNAPVYKRPEPLPPVGAVFFFRVAGSAAEQPVFAKPGEDAEKVGTRARGEVVRVTDFKGAWCRLAVETEAQAEERWEGWMVAEDGEDTLLEEIEDPADHEKEYTKDLFRRIWKINDHVASRLKERTERALQYLHCGRVPPGKKTLLPQGTRCVNAFWGLEARFVKLAEGEEYWPQGCLTLSPGYVRSGWEQPTEEARSGHWRIFAARPFEAHELIEVCPLVPVDVETCIASFQLRMNIVETPADEDAGFTGKTGRVRSYVPLGYGMLYQQSIELDDVKINWTPVTNFNCKFVPVKDHMYIYATRKIQADEELILEYKRCFRTDQGESINFEGFTPYWCRRELPQSFGKALVAPCGPRKVRPIPGQVKFGRSKLHNRGVFADANYKKGEILEMCPCLILDTNGADCMQDYCFHLPEVQMTVEGRSLVKRQARYVLPCGYGGLYNHLEAGQGENVQWFFDETSQCCVWVAHPKDGAEEVLRNEELCFDYGQAYWDAPNRRQQRPVDRISAVAGGG